MDVAGYDELAAFDDDIEQEGSPTFPVTSVLKARSGQSPSVAPRPKREAPVRLSVQPVNPRIWRFHVACPHQGGAVP